MKDDGQIITACAFIHHDFGGVEKVFLAKRADTKKFLPGAYELPGGHIEYGEDIVVGLKREILEELGMNVSVGDPFSVFTYTNDAKNSHYIEVIYFARFEEPPGNVKINPEDHSSFEWVSENELGKVATPNKREDDHEFGAIRKGFSLLKGARFDF